jgi:hypothetical protein
VLNLPLDRSPQLFERLSAKHSEIFLQMQACVSVSSAESHAYAALDDMLITRIPALVEAHDALAAALNAASPDTPILSLVTEQPA